MARHTNQVSNLVAFSGERPPRQLHEAFAEPPQCPASPSGMPEIARRLAASEPREQACPVPGRRYRAENGEAFTLISLDGEEVIVRFAGESHDEQHDLRRLGRLSEVRQRDPDFIAPASRRAANLPAVIPAADFADPFTTGDWSSFSARAAEAAQAVMRAAPVAALFIGALAIGLLLARAMLGAGL